MRRLANFLVLTALVSLAGCDSGPVQLRLVAPSSDLDLEIVQTLEVLLDQSTAVRIQITDDQQPGEAALDMLIAGEADLALVSNYLHSGARHSCMHLSEDSFGRRWFPASGGMQILSCPRKFLLD